MHFTISDSSIISTFWEGLRRRPLLFSSPRSIDRDLAEESLSCYRSTEGHRPGREKTLLKELRASFARARSFAEAKDFEQAFDRMNPFTLTWQSVFHSSDRCRLLIANCSLSTLALVADAGRRGWDLVIEDCPFSRRFIGPVGARYDRRVEFRSSRFIRSRQREVMQSESERTSLFVTFCDRPLWTASDGFETQVAGSRYYFSVVDALLMVTAPHVFLLGRDLREVSVAERVDWTKGEISGAALLYWTALCSSGLSDIITSSPDQYLGMSQLITRHVQYRARVEKNQKALVKSLLHYCQLNGMSIPAPNYRQLLYELDLPEGHETEVSLHQ